MAMNKVIKEFKEKEYTYKLGYVLFINKIYPNIEIYKNDKLLSEGCLGFGTYEPGLFFFYTSASFSEEYGDVDTIKEMFNKLREYSDIPEYIEKEYESLFLLYKLNDFKEL